MSEWLPQIQPRHAFDVRTELRNGVQFLEENSIVYGVGRHLAIHKLDNPTILGTEPLQQDMTFLMRPFIDRPPMPAIATALGGQGPNTNVAASATGYDASTTAALLPTGAKPSSAVANLSDATTSVLSDLSARQHAAQLTELIEKESFLQDRSMLMSAFGIIACPSSAPSIAESAGSATAASGPSGFPDRGARRQLALAEYSDANRMATVSILDLRRLRQKGSGVAEGEELNQINVKDIRSHTLFLPWNQFAESKIRANTSKDEKGNYKKRKGATNAADEESVNLNLTSVEQTAAATVMAADSINPNVSPDQQTASSSAAHAASNLASSLKIESTIYASSAPRIIQNKFKDRSAASMQERRDRKAAAKAAKMQRRNLRQDARQVAEFKDAEIPSDEDFSGSSCTDEEEDNDELQQALADEESGGSDFHSQVREALDSEDEQLLSEHEDESNRKDEDFDYERARKDETASYASSSPSNTSRKSQKKNRSPSPTHANSSKITLTRKLTHTLAQTPINRSLSVAYKNGLFQQPSGVDAAAQVAAAAPLNPAQSNAFQMQVTQKSSFTKAIALEFSSDGRYLAIQCDGPAWPLLIWDWQYRQRIMGHPRWVRQSVHTIRWNPNDNTELSVMGPHVFLQYKLQSSVKHQEASVTSLVTLLNKEEQFSTFCYLPQHHDAMIVCKTNKILVLNRAVVVQSLDVSSLLASIPNPVSGGAPIPASAIAHSSGVSAIMKQHHISSVCPTEKGFAIGTSIHPVGTAYPFSNEMGFDAGSLMTPFNSTNPSAYGSITPFPSLLLLYEFQHSRTLDITPSFDFEGHPKQQQGKSKNKGGSDRVISTTLFDRSFHGQQQSKESMQAFRTKCIPLWRNQTGTSKKLPFSLHSLAVAPNHSTLALTSSTREVFLLNLSDVDLVDDSLAAQLYFKPLVEGLHNVPIIQMDVSQELPLVLTCSSEDNSVRIFNYLQRSCEIVKVFEEETPNCVAIHPSGYEMMVAFPHHLVQYRILLGSSELLLRGEISMPSITCIKYSNNGNYAAVVSSKVIYVYATNTLKAVVKLKGHSDIITSLSWSGDDSLLTSVGSNGCIYTWHLKSGTRLHHQDYINNSLSYNDIVTLPNGDIAVVGIQQHSLGFDMQGLLNPPLDASASATASSSKEQKVYKRAMAPMHSPKKGELVYLSDIPNEAPKMYSTSSHQFVIQWNNRAKFLQNPTLLDASSALQYIHYDSEAAKTVEETANDKSSARSPANNKQNEEDVTTIVTPTAGKGLDFLATAEMEIKPYLPVATSFHQRSVANAKHELETDRARGAVSRNVNEGHRPRPGSAVMRSTPSSSINGEATAADSDATSRTSLSLRPKSAMPSNRRMASGSTLASFLNHDREKEECPLPTLLTTAMLQVGRMTFLLVGTPRGTIQLYPWPMVPGVADPISETPLHSEPITSLKVCQKTQVIVSTALDGSLFISSIAVVINHALGSNVNSSATGTNDVDQSSHFGSSPAAMAHATPSSPTYIFPLHLFLSPSFYPSLFSLTASSRLRQDTYGEQKKLLDAHDDALVVLRKAERSRYGVRRLEGMEDEYDYSLCRRSESVAAQRELKELRAQLKQFQDEWEYKMRRDKENMGKILSEASSKHAEEKAALAAKETALTMRDNERERLTLERLNKKEKEYEITIVHLENLYEKKLALEAERYKELVKKMGDLDHRCAMDRLKLEQEYEKRISEMSQKHGVERTVMQNEISSFHKRYADLKEESVAIVEEECMENDVMLATVENMAKASDNDLRKQLLEMHESQALLRQQIAQLTLKLQRSQANQREAEVGKERSEAAQREGLKRTNLANKKVKSLEENEVVLQKQLEESQAATDKLKQEKRDLRDQIAALLQERADRDPAKTIAAFEAIVKEMDEEFLLAHVANRQAEAAAATHRSTEQALRNEIQLWKKRAEKKEIILEGLREDVWGMKDLRLLREKYFRVLLGEKSNVLGVGSSSKGAFDPSEGQKPWVGVGGGPGNAPTSPSKGGSATSRRGGESVEETQAIEREYLRQTKKNMATISYLEHKVEEQQKALSVSSSGHVADNVQLMTQINELRVVNRDFKEEIVRLTGVVAHQKLMLSAAARMNQSQAAQMGGFTAAANPQIQAMVSIRQAQQAAQLASPDDHAPPDMKAELQALAQLLAQEKRISAEATAQVDESEAALRKIQARATAVEESRNKIIEEQEQMLNATAKRIEQQDAEIRHLRPLAAGHVSRIVPHAVTYAPTDGASIMLPQQTASAHASYVDSVLARAAALRTQFGSQASLADDAAHEENEEPEDNLDVSNVPSTNSSRPTSARPLSASFHFNQGADFSSQVHKSYAVPIRGNTNRKIARPQTATVRGSKSVEMSQTTSSSGSGTPLQIGAQAVPVAAVKTARPASAVLKGGGRAGRNSWNASTATTRTGSSESSAVGSGVSSVVSTAGPTPIPAAQASTAFKQGLRGGALTTRARPSSAVHFSTNKSTPGAAASESSTVVNRSMISTWMEEPSAQLSVDAAGIKPSPPVLRPSSAQTLATAYRSQRPVSAVSIPSSNSTRPTSAVSEMSEGMHVHEDEDGDDY